MKAIYIIVMAGMVAGCSTQRPLETPAIRQMPENFEQGDGDTPSIANLSWRQFFNDKYLVDLIDTALTNNPDLLIALERIESARAQWRMRKSALFPQVNAGVSASFDHYGDYTMTGVGNFDTNLSPNIKEDQKVERSLTPDFFVGLRSTWEVDVFGRLKNQKRAAAARLLATEKGRQFAITHIVSTVAALYFELITLDNELDIVRKNIVLQEEALEVVKIQKEGGRATELAVQQFAAQLLNTRGIAFSLQQQRVEVENQLNEVLGRYMQPVARDTSLVQLGPPLPVSAGNPSQLLIRRPDIVQAEMQMVAARADVNAARAAFLPSLQLTPYAGFNAFKAALLFDPGSLVGGFTTSLAAPLLNRGLLKAELKMADASRREAIYQYQKALLSAYNEVTTNLKAIENANSSLELKKEEVAELSKAVATARELYLAGYANYLEVITSQKGALDAELELIQLKQQLLNARVALYRSLGGGWN